MASTRLLRLVGGFTLALSKEAFLSPQTKESVGLVSVPLRTNGEYTYGVEVHLGDQNFTVLLDTGSPIFAVAASPDVGGPYFHGPCNGPNTSFGYGGGGFTGAACDGVEVRLGQAAAGQPLFAGITSVTSHSPFKYGRAMFTGAAYQGILGMAYRSEALFQDAEVYQRYLAYFLHQRGLNVSKAYLEKKGALNSNLFTPLFDSVVTESGDLADVFSLQQCGTTHADGFPGTLVLGGVNHSLHTGEIKYTPILGEGLYFVDVIAIGTSSGSMMTSPAASIDPMTPPMLNISDDAFMYFQMESTFFYVDTGNPYMFLGASYHTVKESINAAASDLGLGDVFPSVVGEASPSCVKATDLDAFPDIVIRLQGDVTLRVPPSKYFQAQKDTDCLWLFIGEGGHGLLVLGNPVLETYYTVYDRVNKQLGFAPVAGCA